MKSNPQHNQFVVKNSTRINIFFRALAGQTTRGLRPEHVSLEGMEDWTDWDSSKDEILLVPDFMKI